MELIIARAQQQHEALSAIQRITERKHVPLGNLSKADLRTLAKLLYERLDEVHTLTQQGLAKPAAEEAHEALNRAAITGEGMDEALQKLLSTPLPLPLPLTLPKR